MPPSTTLPKGGTLRLQLIVRTIFILGIVTVILFPPNATPPIRNAAAQSSLPTVYVHPSNITDPTLGPSDGIAIEVCIANVTDLSGFDIQLRWNASLLNYTGHLAKIPVEDHPDGVLHEPVMQIKNEVNATAGTYWIAFATLAGPSFNGSGTIFAMNFTIIGFGECALDISNSDLSNSEGSAISHTVQDGYFSNAFYDIVVLDVAASSPTVLIGETVNITVVVRNNGTTRNETFNVTAYYNTTSIHTEIVVELPPSAETTLQFHWNTTGLSPGDYILSANATSVPGEASTENNRLVNGIVSVIIEPVHDVAVTSLTPCKSITALFQKTRPTTEACCKVVRSWGGRLSSRAWRTPVSVGGTRTVVRRVGSTRQRSSPLMITPSSMSILISSST